MKKNNQNNRDMNNFLSYLKCPHCGATCKDYQSDSGEEYKEDHCGECDNPFGYEEDFRHCSFSGKTRTYYKTYKL